MFKTLRRVVATTGHSVAEWLDIPVAWAALFAGGLLAAALTPAGFAAGHLVGHHAAIAAAAGEISALRSQVGTAQQQLGAVEISLKQANAAAGAHALEHTRLMSQASQAKAKLAACSSAQARRTVKPPARLELEDGTFVTKP